MKVSFSVLIVYLYLLSVFIVECLGLPNGRQYARIIIGIFPFVLFSIDFIRNHTIKVPVYISLLFTFFSIITAISTITAIHVQTAFENQLMYWGVFLTFLYIYNHQEIKKYIPHFIFVLTILLLLYSLFINLLLPSNLLWLISNNGFQFAYIHNNDNAHFAFGSFVLIPLIFIFKLFVEKPTWIKGILLSILLILLIASFLRASYVAFLVVAILIFKSGYAVQYRKRLSVVLILIGLVVISSFILITTFQNDIFSQLPFKNVIVNNVDILKNKTFLNGRDEFIHQSIEAIKLKPFTGFGTFNYYYVSLLFAQNISYATGSSHNIFVDIFVENGIIGGFIFLTIIIFFIKNIFQNIKKREDIDSNISLVILSLLLLFQFSHYHKYYFLILFVFFLSALIYKEKNILKDEWYISTIGASILFCLTLIITTSLLFINNKKYQQAIWIYPISAPAYQSYILSLQDQKDMQKGSMYLERLSNLYPNEPDIQDYIGNIYTLNSDHQNALKHYQVALKSSPSEVSYLTFIYNELEAIKGSEYAKQFVENYISSNRSHYEIFLFESHWFYDWCIEKGINIYDYMLLTE